jgi:hypothetical protein
MLDDRSDTACRTPPFVKLNQRKWDAEDYRVCLDASLSCSPVVCAISKWFLIIGIYLHMDLLPQGFA